MSDDGNPIDAEMEDANAEQAPRGQDMRMDAQLPPQLINVIRALPPQEQEVVKAMFIAISVKESFRGPLPPPDMLAKYNDAFPNGAQHIFNMAKDQSAHRMDLEKSTIKEQQRQGSNGQIYGLIIGVLGLLIAGVCAYTGHDAVGGIIGGIDLVGLVGIFVLGKYKQSKDLEDKEDS
jgi:uncharacterized membrane protein